MAMNSRQALVIGNDAYAIGALPFCVNDAIGMKNALRSIGFHTHCETDRGIDQMQSMANRFVQSIQPGSIALFYFSGHGLQYNGVNFLSPVDNDGEIDQNHMDRSRLNVQKLVDAMEKKRPRLMIIILDACRSDSALNDRVRFADRSAAIFRPGLGPIRAPPGTIIAFACAADEVSSAKSKYGNNSVYTYHLLRHLTTPNIDIDLALRKVAADVQHETKNGQTPFRYSSCNEVICLVSNAAMNHPRGFGQIPQRIFMSKEPIPHQIYHFVHLFSNS